MNHFGESGPKFSSNPKIHFSSPNPKIWVAAVLILPQQMWIVRRQDMCLQARHLLCLQPRNLLCQQTMHLWSPETSQRLCEDGCSAAVLAMELGCLERPDVSAADTIDILAADATDVLPANTTHGGSAENSGCLWKDQKSCNPNLGIRSRSMWNLSMGGWV